MRINGVFEGGGVKGIGFIGAIRCIEEYGYQWGNLAGTSAGAIMAALLVAGYTGTEIQREIFYLYNKYHGKWKSLFSSKLPKPIGLLKHKGIYTGKEIEDYISELLKRKGVRCFGDVMKNGQSRLKIIATDITRGELITLPEDLKKYNLCPSTFEIAKAVRMSISIPFYFEPVKLYYEKGWSFIVDGGLTSNFPIWIFDGQETFPRPTFGFKLEEDSITHTAKQKEDFLSYIMDVINAAMYSWDEHCIKDLDKVRIISIPTLAVKTIQLDLPKEKIRALIASGYESTAHFLQHWSFERYKELYSKEGVLFPRKKLCYNMEE